MKGVGYEKIKNSRSWDGRQRGCTPEDHPQVRSDLSIWLASATSTSSRATETAQRMSVSGYTDIETLIEMELPDVILITVGPDGHHVITEIAASHGVHVITETPISITLPCTDRMIDAAAQHGTKLEVAENVWRWPHERLKRKIVDAGLIGEITHAHLWYTSGSYHGMNAIRTLVQSDAVRVIGHAKKVGDSSWEVGIVEFENGVSLVYEFPTRRRSNYWEIDGTEGGNRR